MAVAGLNGNSILHVDPAGISKRNKSDPSRTHEVSTLFPSEYTWLNGLEQWVRMDKYVDRKDLKMKYTK